MATTLPPTRKAKPTEAEIEAVINRGSSALMKEGSKPLDDNTVKYFNLRLTQGVLNTIEGFRAKRPRKLASPKLGISTHDWIIEAIEEKMERERTKYSM